MTNITKLLRDDLQIIVDLVAENSRILDLGCGDGTLLSILRKQKNIKGSGIELSQEQILRCVNKGVPVVQGDLNNGLDEFQDNSFDYIILSQTLQSVQRPDELVMDMTRKGKKVIISLINMGYYKNRYQLAIKGQMPVNKILPYKWYSTPNIHLGSIKDFINMCNELNINIIKKIPINKKENVLAQAWPNLCASICVFILSSYQKD